MEGSATPSQAPYLPAVRALVVGLGLLALAYFLAAPLVHYAAIVACGLLLAVAIATPAAALSRRTPVPYRASVAIVVLTVLGLLVGFFAWTGPQVVEQVRDLDQEVQTGIENAREWLDSSDAGRGVSERVEELDSEMGGAGSDMASSVGHGLSAGIDALTGVAIVIFLGLFVAISPRLYARGLLKLAPPPRRARLDEVGHAAIKTLRSWLAARLFLMALIGTAFGIGLAVLGVPLAIPLGVLTGLLAFVPYVGAVLSVVPAMAVAFTAGPELALQVLALYVALQLIESYVLDPIVEARAVSLPPALVLLAQVVSAVWFGAIGVIIATPLLVVVVVAVRMLYIEDRLGDREPDVDAEGSAPKG
jgi:predicted PurR-regulated permease PerM